MTNNVQSLDKKRGRPKSPILAHIRKNFPTLTSRQSLNNKSHAFECGIVAIDLGLVDSEFRDKTTGKRVMTKLAELGRLLGSDYLDTENGKQWLAENWPAIVAMTTAQLIEWRKTQ